MKKILSKLLLLIFLTLLGSISANANPDYCLEFDGEKICIPIVYPEYKFPWEEDCIYCNLPDFTNSSDGLINPQVYQDVVALNMLGVIANRLSPDLRGTFQEDLRSSAQELRFPPNVGFIENTGRKRAGSWSLTFRASNGRRIVAPVPLIGHEPDPNPWIVDELLNPQVAQDLLNLASMDVMANHLSDEFKTHFQTRIQQATFDLDLPADVVLKFH